MNNDALVAALGRDAVAAVHGYRLHVISEAERRGLRVVSETLSDIAPVSADVHIVDPIDIRLTFHHSCDHGDLAGRMLRWGPAHGWSLSRTRAQAHLPFSYYAGLDAAPLHLVPTAPEVLDWATRERGGSAAEHCIRPRRVELDDDPKAIHRLLGFIDPQHRLQGHEAFAAADRRPAHDVHPRAHRSCAESSTAGPSPNNGSRDIGPAIRQARRSGRLEDSMPLSPREQRILAGIENELGEKDPALAATFTRARLSASFWQRFPLSAGHTCLLVLALLTLVVLHPLALELGAIGLGILTGALIVPWMVGASWAAERRDGTNASRAPRTGLAAQGLLKWRDM